MTRRLVEHARSLIEFNGGEPFSAAKRLDNDNPGATTPSWPLLTDPRLHYHLRSILPRESVLDIGDNVDEATAARHANALAARLRSIGCPHWVALSGGSGIHIHVFVASEEQRRPLVRWVLECAFNDTFDEHLSVDPRKVAPGPRSLIREFGAHKKAGASRRKSLWCAWPQEDWRDVPESLDEAYAQCDGRLPPPPEAFDASRFDFSIRDAFGGVKCPQSSACLEAWGLCNSCPVGA